MIKKAFTVAEVLVVMAIVGILTAIGLNTFKVNYKSIKYLYSNTYYAISTALYNSINYQNANDFDYGYW